MWLALAAVLLRALIPDGFMLERHAGEPGVALAICYASPLAKLRADQGAPGASHVHGDCVFSAAAGPALPSSGVDSGFGIRVPDDVIALAAPSHLFSRDDRRPPVRGPPELS